MWELALLPVEAEGTNVSHEASGGFVVNGVIALPNLVLAAIANGVISGLWSWPPHVNIVKSLKALGI